LRGSRVPARTRTRDTGSGAGGVIALRRSARPTVHKGVEARDSRRENGIPLWYRGQTARQFSGGPRRATVPFSFAAETSARGWFIQLRAWQGDFKRRNLPRV